MMIPLALLLAAAGFKSAPVIEPNPNPAAPLAAILRFTPAAPVETIVTVSDGRRKWEVRFDRSRNPADGLPIAGFRAGRKHELRVQIRDAAGRVTRAPQALEFTAPALPAAGEEFPPIQVKASLPQEMEPGWTLLSVRRQRRGGMAAGAGGAGRTAVRKGAGKAAAKAPASPPGEAPFATGYGLILALDEQGEVVWYYRGPNRTADVHRLRNGNIAFITNDNRLVEADLLGNIKGEWCAARRPQGACTGIPVDALTMHHSFQELPNGNFLLVSGELREIDNYYTSETDPRAPRKRQKVMGDQIVEFDRAGRVVWRWSAFDHLDVFRLGYLTINQYWVIRGFPDTVDWTHGNGVFHDERDDSVLFNSRQQSSVFKIERPSGRIAWIFGEPGGWPERFRPLLFNPAGVSEWPWHHHAPRLTPRGTLMVFNNGIMKTRPFNPPVADSEVISGALEYAIDPKAHTARLVWASDVKGQPETVNTFAMGDVSPLPKTGNVLVVYGSAVRGDTRQPWTRVREYRRTTPPRVVYDVVLADAEGQAAVTWVAFGGERVAPFE
ncbi:MAG: aryl-sulfate sulfotransferase [Bryobacteraceae bacterium]